MANLGEEVYVQLATRIPKELHREIKLHCVRTEMSVMDFVVAALRAKLPRAATANGNGKPKPKAKPAARSTPRPQRTLGTETPAV